MNDQYESNHLYILVRYSKHRTYHDQGNVYQKDLVRWHVNHQGHSSFVVSFISCF